MIKDIRTYIEEKAAAHAAAIKENQEQIQQLEHELEKAKGDSFLAMTNGSIDAYTQAKEKQEYLQTRLEYLRSISVEHTFSKDEACRVQEDLNTHAADELRPLYIKVQEHLDAGKQLYEQILAVLTDKAEASRMLYSESPDYAVSLYMAFVPPSVKKILLPDGATYLASLIER